MSFNWKSLIGSVAPTLATAFGGPLAGSAVSAISQAVLGKPDGTDEELTKALSNATPETIAAVKKADQDFQVKMKSLDIDLEKLGFDDLKDARGREVETTKVTGRRDTNLYVLAWTVVISFFITCAILIFVKMPEGQSNIVYMLLGTLGTGFITVLSYFFGSSKGSAEKTEHLAEIAKQ